MGVKGAEILKLHTLGYKDFCTLTFRQLLRAPAMCVSRGCVWRDIQIGPFDAISNVDLYQRGLKLKSVNPDHM